MLIRQEDRGFLAGNLGNSAPASCIQSSFIWQASAGIGGDFCFPYGIMYRLVSFGALSDFSLLFYLLPSQSLIRVSRLQFDSPLLIWFQFAKCSGYLSQWLTLCPFYFRFARPGRKSLAMGKRKASKRLRKMPFKCVIQLNNIFLFVGQTNIIFH